MSKVDMRSPSPDTLSQAIINKKSGVVLKPIRLPCDMCIYGHDGAQLQWHFDLFYQ